MRKIENIEREIRDLTPSELAAFRRWFLEFDAQVWDHQIEEDLRKGRLDKLAEELWQHTALERVRSFETFCCSNLLGSLSSASKISSRSC
jgi:hypothetical protein